MQTDAKLAGLFDKTQSVLTVDDLAQMFGVSKLTVYAWVHHRKIAYVKIGRHVRFLPEDVAAWLKKRRRAAHA